MSLESEQAECVSETVRIGGVLLIDTLNLMLDDFEVDSVTQLCVEPHSYQADTGVTSQARPLWVKANGHSVYGKKAQHIGEHFVATIKAQKQSTVADCYVQLSLPKFCSGNNLFPVTLSQSQKAMRRLESELNRIGIRADLKTAKLSRLDLFRNIQTDEPFSSYRGLFCTLKAQRQQRREWDTTFLWGNTQQQTQIYDKRVEMQRNGRDVSRCPPNTMRCEYRMMNGQKIRQVLRGRTVEHLWSEYENLPAIYNNAIRQTLFKEPLPHHEVLTGSQLERELRSFQSTCGRNWLPLYLQAQGAKTVFEQCGSETFLQTFSAVLKNDENPRTRQQRLYRVNRDMNQATAMLTSLQSANTSARTLGDLRRELEQKLLIA